MSWEANAAHAAGLVQERELAEARAEIEKLRAALRKIRTGIDTGQINAERAANIAEIALRDAGASEQTEDRTDA